MNNEIINDDFDFLTLVLYIFSILPYIGVVGISAIIGGFISQVWQTAALLVLLARFVQKNDFGFDRFTISFAVFNMWVFLSTTINLGFSVGILAVQLSAVLLMFLLMTDYKIILHAISIIAYIIIFINFLTVLLIGRDSHKNYFIGGKNKLSLVIIPAILLVIIYEILIYNSLSKKVFILMLMGIMSILIAGSGTGLVVSAFTVLVLLFFWRFSIDKKLVVIFIVSGYCLLLVGTSILTHSTYWISFSKMLGKGSDLTYRTDIWQIIFDKVKLKPLLGIGRGAPISFYDDYGGFNTVYEAHNFIMELILEGGWLGFSIYLFGIWDAIRKIDNKSFVGRTVFAAVVIIFINGLTESVNNSFLIIMLIGVLNSLSYVNQEELTNE